MSPVTKKRVGKRVGRARSRLTFGVNATAEETLAALHDAHARHGGTVPVTSLPDGLYAAVLQHFGSIAEARQRLGLAPPDRARVWSRAKVLAELRRLFRSGVALNRANLRGYRGLVGAITNHAGGLRKARALAGLPAPEHNWRARENDWDDLEVVRVIEQRAKNGEPLAASKVPSALYCAARKHWGSWERAIEAAGLDYATIRQVRPAWTGAEIIEELRRMRVAHPAMTRSEFSKSSIGQVSEKEFGSLDHALVAAEITDWPRYLQTRLVEVSHATLRASLRALKRRGVPLTYAAITTADPRLYRTLRRTIPGPWSQVLATLGLDDPTPRWDRDRVLGELRAAHARGEALNGRGNQQLAARARYYFGSLAKAVQILGVKAKIRPQLHRSPEDVLEEIRRLSRGFPHVSISRAGRGLASAAYKHFGSWRNACEAAGVEPGGAGGWPRLPKKKNGRAQT
jgi:hypothetical protein